ncbi:MAG: hypothetical protein EA357_11405 [Micavibrio sp.]|nr:MAG: hypothetical protein EA357_11405 [Micavibrio sp.]
MRESLRLIEQELITKLLSGQTPLNTFKKGEQIFLALCIFFVAVGAVFLIYATYLWSSGHYSAEMAAALTGAFSLICALVVAIAIYGIIAYRRIRIMRMQRSLFEKVKVSLAAFEDEYGAPIREYPKISVLLTSVAGFILEKRLF